MNPIVNVIGIGRFEWQGNPSNLLQALEDAGVDISYSCACGACHLILKEGQVHWIQQPIVSLSKGQILACCVIPKGDISIQLPD